MADGAVLVERREARGLTRLEAALSPRTRAVMIAHTLGYFKDEGLDYEIKGGTIGEAAPQFARTLDGKVPCTVAGTLEQATSTPRFRRRARTPSGRSVSREPGRHACLGRGDALDQA